MTPQQHKFRQAAIAGFIFGIVSTIALLILPLIGLTASFIETVRQGEQTELLFTKTTGWYALLGAGLLSFIAPGGFTTAAIFFDFTLEAVTRSRETWLYRATKVCITGAATLGLVLGGVYQYTFVHSPSPARLEVLNLVLSLQYIFSFTLSLVAAGTYVEGYLSRTLSARVCLILGLGEVALLVFQFISMNPNVNAGSIILFYLFGSIRTVALAAYFLLLSLPGLNRF